MSHLERLIDTPRLVELDFVEVDAPPERVWERLRHGELAPSPLIEALFWIRTIPDRLRGRAEENSGVRIDDLRSSPDRPGFQILGEDPPRELAVGAIGKVWHTAIPFVHVADAEAFAAFDESDYAKVAWAIRVLPIRGGSRIEFEVRVDTTDEESWKKFRRYFGFIGPASRFIRRSLLSRYEREFGPVGDSIEQSPLPGDDLLPDAAGHMTDTIVIDAPPDAVWPWLVQMGCRRAGFYSYDVLDNAGVRSAREIHPEWQDLKVGDVIPATPNGDDGFEVLVLDAPRLMILGGLYDSEAGRQLRFADARPERYWHVTWAFVLDTIDGDRTRLSVRARAAFPHSDAFHAAWIKPVHRFMESAQLRHLKERVESVRSTTAHGP